MSDPYAEVTKTREFRREVRRLFRKRVLFTRRWWLAIGIYAASFMLMMATIDWFAVPARKLFLFWMPRWLDRPLFGSVLGAILGLGLNLFIRKPMLRCRWEALTARGIPVCLECGYDLRGQVENVPLAACQPVLRCPECGTTMEPDEVQTSRRV